MTQKFKFGDRVRHPKYGECMVVTQWYDADTDDPTWVSIISEIHGECDSRHEELESIPHPDTARLNFIQENFIEIKVFDDERQTNYFCINNNMSNANESIRALIDNAMQREQTP
ncbi:Uncharacterised protein [Alysiella crassa]|uniref:Uncharacterized protein n=2 Tax=Alysiella crassa TaxID=153491 RepID=A0A376BXM1_9NEIS|nr:Uncharacterised protein [Alysiella crassa]